MAASAVAGESGTLVWEVVSRKSEEGSDVSIVFVGCGDMPIFHLVDMCVCQSSSQAIRMCLAASSAAAVCLEKGVQAAWYRQKANQACCIVWKGEAPTNHRSHLVVFVIIESDKSFL